MSNTESPLVQHARHELELSGQWAEDPEYSQSIVNAVAAFASYGHSGGSAAVATEQLRRLLRFETLSPLTASPAEWIDQSEINGAPLWQSTRNPKAFSRDGGQTWWLIEDEDDDAAPKAKIDWMSLPGDAPDAFVLVLSGWRGEPIDQEVRDLAAQQIGARAVLVFDEPVEVA